MLSIKGQFVVQQAARGRPTIYLEDSFIQELSLLIMNSRFWERMVPVPLPQNQISICPRGLNSKSCAPQATINLPNSILGWRKIIPITFFLKANT